MVEILVPMFSPLLLLVGFENARMPRRIRLLGADQGAFVRKRAQPAQQLPVNLLLVVFVEGALLLALLASFGSSVFPVAVVATMALPVDEGGNDATILTAGWLPVLLNVALTLFANTGGAAFTENINKINTRTSGLKNCGKKTAFKAIFRLKKQNRKKRETPSGKWRLGINLNISMTQTEMDHHKITFPAGILICSRYT